jgi:hypothetical protein
MPPTNKYAIIFEGYHMRCYYHNEIEAVGICNAYNKGICSECAEDTGNGLACKDTCIDEVKAVNEIIEKKNAYITSVKNPPQSLLGSFSIFYLPYFLLDMGCIFQLV